jgi:hypothetical protein
MKALLCRNCSCVLGLIFGTLRRHGLNAVKEDIMRVLKRESPDYRTTNMRPRFSLGSRPSKRVQPVERKRPGVSNVYDRIRG